MAELAVTLILLQRVLHASLCRASLGRTRGNLGCRASGDCPLWHLHRFLFRLLHLYLLLLLPLVLHILVQRYRVILLLVRLLWFLRRSQARNTLVLIGDLRALPVE